MTIKKSAALAVFALCAWVGKAQADDSPIKTETRHLQVFKDLEIDCSATATFSVAPTASVTITAPANLLPLLLTKIEGGRLVIRRKEGLGISKFPSFSSSDVKLAITGPSLGSIAVLGSASVKAPELTGGDIDLNLRGSGTIEASGATAKNLTVELPGSGEIVLNGINGKSIKLNIEGSGRIKAAGVIDHVDGSIAGSGQIQASDLKAQTLDANIVGSGDLKGFASKSANVIVTGSGDVTIGGNPPERRAENTGSGDITFK